MRSSSQKRLNLYCQLDFWSYEFPFSLSAADQCARLHLLHQLAWITAPNSSVMTFLLKLQPHIAQSLRLVDVCQRHQEALETEEWSDWWFKVIHMKSMWIGPCHILCSLLVGIGLNKMETSATRLIQNIEHCPTKSLWNVPCGKLSSWSQSSMIGAASLFQANLALCCPKTRGFWYQKHIKKEASFPPCAACFLNQIDLSPGQPVGRKNRWNSEHPSEKCAWLLTSLEAFLESHLNSKGLWQTYITYGLFVGSFWNVH